jgi:hypothetical protein
MDSAFGSFGAGERGIQPGGLLKLEMQKGQLEEELALAFARTWKGQPSADARVG